ncbi:MAG TPA: PP2C family protein-serine/threonine phosphatase [Candidatus Ozemobacteraceae bacterium]|nr:PP2C family protein-serine/threonine phosphatase [Candidatus Ozemobacteraceae bacterium]
MKTLLAAISLAAVALFLVLFMAQAQWLSQGAAFLRKDLHGAQRVIRYYERLLLEHHDLRLKRIALEGRLDHEYRQPLDLSLQVISDVATEIDQLLVNHPRRYRWIQISGIVSAHQGAIRTYIRLAQQLELATWKAGSAGASATVTADIHVAHFLELVRHLSESATGMSWLHPYAWAGLAGHARALLMSLSSLANLLPPPSFDEQSIRLSLARIRQEAAGYEATIATMVRREIDQFWRDLSSTSELFVSQGEAYFSSRLPAWGFFLFICGCSLFYFHYRIALHLRQMSRRFSDSSLPTKIPPLPPSGIREIDEFERCLVQIADNFHRELQMNSRHIKAITTIWNVLGDLGRERADLREKPSDALSGSLERLLTLLGNQVPSISLARILESTNDGLFPMTQDYVSPAFRSSEKFAAYTRSTGARQRLGWTNSLSGWIARHAAIDPWTPDSGGDVYRISAPLRQIREFGLTPTHEQGLDGAVIGIRLLSQKGETPSDNRSGLLVLYFDDPENVPGESDWMFMTIMAHQIVSVIETAELLDISNRQRHLTSQLGIAREIQASTRPPKPPVVNGLEIDAVISMASQVGGDYYDFIPFRDGRIGIVVADVSGKGVPAALLTMVLKTTFKALRVETLSPAQVLREVNRILIGIIAESYFITMTYGIIDPSTRSMNLANAGHTPVLHRTKNGGSDIVIPVEIPGYPLGVIETSFKERKVTLEAGDTLLFFTDGVLDCCNKAGERFGMTGLETFLKETSSVNLPARRLLARLDSFREGLDAPDDITAVSVTFQNGDAGTAQPESNPDHGVLQTRSP